MKLNTLFVYIKDPRRTIKVLILRYGAGKEVRNDKKLKRAALHTAYKAQQDYLDRIHAEHLQEAAILDGDRPADRARPTQGRTALHDHSAGGDIGAGCVINRFPFLNINGLCHDLESLHG